MKILARYISLRFLLAISLVFLLCFSLVFLIDFMEVLRRTSKIPSSTTSQALLISVLRVPGFVELTLPFAVLIGSIGAFLTLGRSSELIVIRSSGMSVWQFVLPGVVIAMLTGIAANYLFNPAAAAAKATSERLLAELLGNEASALTTGQSGAWLRQDGPDGQTVLTAAHSADHGLTLSGVTVFQYNKSHKFVERIEAKKAVLKNGRWVLHDAWVSAVGSEPAFYRQYLLSTYLSPTQVKDSLGSVETVSFLDLPNFIEISEKAGVPANRYRLQYQILLSRPLLLMAMVLIAATCSLRAFRFGNIQALIISGLGAGFVFFLFAEVSRNLGLSGLVSPAVAAWGPATVGCLAASTVLLYQEDG